MRAQQWIYDNLADVDIPEIVMQEIQDFLLLWSTFEGRFLETNFEINRVLKLIDEITLTGDSYNQVGGYFKNRYAEQEDSDRRFNGLGIRNQGHKDLVESFLLSGEPNLKTVVKSSMIIVYRFRNNLFHGVKEFEYLHTQEDNFQNANEFLKQLMIDIYNTPDN